MTDLKFTKQDTSIVKGIAIILMFFHHLFGFPDRIANGSIYLCLFSFKGVNVEEVIASFGNICVAIFLFLSGFGVYIKVAKSKENKLYIILRKLRELYVSYWIIFSLFIPISFFIGIRSFDFKEFFNNLIGYSSTYNGEWWFFEVYVFLMIIYPITIKVLRNNYVLSIISIILISTIIHKIIPMLSSYDIFFCISQTSLYNEIIYLLGFLPCFLIGSAFAKFNLFIKIKQFFITFKLDNVIVYTIISIAIIYFRYILYNPTCYDYLFAPIYIFAAIHIIRYLRLDKLFNILGRHSSNMWLMHSFFCYQYFQFFIYYPKITLLIVAWLSAICLSISWIIGHVMKKINDAYSNLKDKIKFSKSKSNLNMDMN